MGRLARTLFILGALAAAALAQSDQVSIERHRIAAGWLGVVRGAESKYRSKYGVYGDLRALRDAHLLNDLIFESENPKKARPGTNFIPKGTGFEVTASPDGRHYKIAISPSWVDFSIAVFGDENSAGFSQVRVTPRLPQDIEDGPEGPLLSSPT